MIDEGDPARVCFKVDWRLYWYRSNIMMGKLPQPPRSFEEHVENLMGVDLAKSQLPLTMEKNTSNVKIYIFAMEFARTFWLTGPHFSITFSYEIVALNMEGVWE